MSSNVKPQSSLHGEILAKAIDNTNEAFVTIDQDSTIIVFNNAAEHIFGYKKEEVLGKNLATILGPGCREQHSAAVKNYLATNKSSLIGHIRDFEAMRRNGEKFPAAISFSESRHEGRLYFTGLIRDLTETRRLEERVIRNERLAALGQTVAEISHEIKNPLVLIGGHARRLARKSDDEKTIERLRIIINEADRLEDLLAEMRDLYVPIRLDFTPVNCGELLTEVGAIVEADCAAKNIKLQLEIGEEKALIQGDHDKLKQVVLNLAKNAVEAQSGHGGELRMSVKVNKDRVIVCVDDTGPGIPTNDLDRIFDPFYTTKKGGTGLGLCVSKRIIEDHPDSLLLVESKTEGGTIFTIDAPQSKDKP